MKDDVISLDKVHASNEMHSLLEQMKIDPTLLGKLGFDVTNDEDVVAAALSGCRNAKQAKKVISSACYDAKNSKKVALALLKIDPTLLGKLSFDVRNDEDVVAAALSGCRNAKQAEKVINSAWFDAKRSKKVALALFKIDPTLLGQLFIDARNDLNVVLLAIELSTEHTIHNIWSSVGSDAAFNPEFTTEKCNSLQYSNLRKFV